MKLLNRTQNFMVLVAFVVVSAFFLSFNAARVNEQLMVDQVQTVEYVMSK
jgi:hypothetical protein